MSGMATVGSALVLVAPRRIEVHEVEVPPPGPGDVRVRTTWSGISSGTEMLAYRGLVEPSLPLDETIGSLGGTFTFPFAFGYSCVGVVEESRADGVAAGDRVFAYHPHQDRFVVSAGDLVALPPGVEDRTATLLPLVETGLQIALDAGPVLEDDVVVVGLGAVGTLAAVMLGRGGARVLAVEPQQDRRRAAAELGVEAVAPADVADALAERGAGGGVGLVVDATGNPPALRSALDLLAHEGTALVASWYGTREVPLPLGGRFHRRRLVVRSTQVSTIPAHLASRWTVPRRRAVAARLLATLPVDALATHEFPFAGAADAFAAVDRGEPGLVHAALCYG